jgi:hypothetical protein
MLLHETSKIEQIKPYFTIKNEKPKNWAMRRSKKRSIEKQFKIV